MGAFMGSLPFGWKTIHIMASRARLQVALHIYTNISHFLHPVTGTALCKDFEVIC